VNNLNPLLSLLQSNYQSQIPKLKRKRLKEMEMRNELRSLF
jgi:hypothetical protein